MSHVRLRPGRRSAWRATFPWSMLAAAAALTACGTGAAAHPHHVSTTELEHNVARKALQASIRVKAVDLEEALSRRAGARVDLDKTKDVDELITAYLRQTFVIVGGDTAPPLTFVGKEVTVKEAWLYVSFAVPEGIAGLTLRNRLFHEIVRDQVNTVLFREGDRERTMRFTRRTPAQPLARDGR